MDGETLQKIRDSLLARRRRISGTPRIVDIVPAPIEPGSQPIELIDIAQSLEQIERDKSLEAQERRYLLAIERALAKMATGSFGICEECGEDIPEKRLIVLPEAKLCARCQTVEEKQSARSRAIGA